MAYNIDDLLPSCLEYSHFLDAITTRDGITRDQARHKYGLYTVKQWHYLLGNK